MKHLFWSEWRKWRRELQTRVKEKQQRDRFIKAEICRLIREIQEMQERTRQS